MVRRPRKKKEKPDVAEALARFRVAGDLLCDACGQPRDFHVPLCAEMDPRLVTFWASLCAPCLRKREQGARAYEKILARGWARGGTVFPGDSLRPASGRDQPPGQNVTLSSLPPVHAWKPLCSAFDG